MYKFLGEQPLEYYSTLVEFIEEVRKEGDKQTEDEEGGEQERKEEMLGCWAEAECGLCAKDGRLVKDGVKYAEKYWEKTRKDELLTKHKIYSRNPTILYDDLLQLVQKEGAPNAELVAFCACWMLFEWSVTNATLSKCGRDVFKLGCEQLVARLV
ncbi:MAG: hypothetical protein ACE5R6_14590 [Candidatus Heimdallarchaeota archaeon]